MIHGYFPATQLALTFLSHGCCCLPQGLHKDTAWHTGCYVITGISLMESWTPNPWTSYLSFFLYLFFYSSIIYLFNFTLRVSFLFLDRPEVRFEPLIIIMTLMMHGMPDWWDKDGGGQNGLLFFKIACTYILFLTFSFFPFVLLFLLLVNAGVMKDGLSISSQQQNGAVTTNRQGSR